MICLSSKSDFRGHNGDRKIRVYLIEVLHKSFFGLKQIIFEPNKPKISQNTSNIVGKGWFNPKCDTQKLPKLWTPYPGRTHRRVVYFEQPVYSFSVLILCESRFGGRQQPNYRIPLQPADSGQQVKRQPFSTIGK